MKWDGSSSSLGTASGSTFTVHVAILNNIIFRYQPNESGINYSIPAKELHMHYSTVYSLPRIFTIDMSLHCPVKSLA